MLRPFIAGCASGALVLSAFHCRRGIAREWHWACRDLADFRAELRGYFS